MGAPIAAVYITAAAVLTLAFLSLDAAKTHLKWLARPTLAG